MNLVDSVLPAPLSPLRGGGGGGGGGGGRKEGRGRRVHILSFSQKQSVHIISRPKHVNV